METKVTLTDLAVLDKSYYQAGAAAEIRDLDKYFYLSMAGKCAPEHADFTQAIQTIYAVAHGIKFQCKGEDNDFVIPKMECHWFIEGGLEVQHLFMETPREEWCWNLLIRMPDQVDEGHFFRAIGDLKDKDEADDRYDQVKFELINEGKCVQVLHVGSWDEEGPSLGKIFSLIEAEGLTVRGYHKEIYLSDPNEVEEAEKQTILRYQVQ